MAETNTQKVIRLTRDEAVTLCDYVATREGDEKESIEFISEVKDIAKRKDPEIGTQGVGFLYISAPNDICITVMKMYARDWFQLEVVDDRGTIFFYTEKSNATTYWMSMEDELGNYIPGTASSEKNHELRGIVEKLYDGLLKSNLGWQKLDEERKRAEQVKTLFDKLK